MHAETYQLSIHFRDSFGSLLWGGQLHKANTTADACVGVAQHLARHDGAKLLHQPYTVSIPPEHALAIVNKYDYNLFWMHCNMITPWHECKSISELCEV